MSDRLINWLLWALAAALFTFLIIDGIKQARSEPRYLLINVPMPPVVTLIVCKTVIAGPPDQNAPYTGYENREWATEYGMMQCRRQEVSLYDQAEALGAAAQPFNLQRCQRSGIMLGTAWDAGHRSSSYRFWRVACPVPIINTITKEIIGWKMPECGHRDTVHCEQDAEI